MDDLNDFERLVLSLFRLENVGPTEHVNHHRLIRHVNWSVVQADDLNKGIETLCEKGLLAPGHHPGFVQLTAEGHKYL